MDKTSDILWAIQTAAGVCQLFCSLSRHLQRFSSQGTDRTYHSDPISASEHSNPRSVPSRNMRTRFIPGNLRQAFVPFQRLSTGRISFVTVFKGPLKGRYWCSPTISSLSLFILSCFLAPRPLCIFGYAKLLNKREIESSMLYFVRVDWSDRRRRNYLQ